MNALKIVQKYFPVVTKVQDAKEPITVEVTKGDNKSSKVLNHTACAMAVACKRMTQADGVIVSLGVAYIINGNKAVRYRLPESVSREVVSFDRNAGFATGVYLMNVPGPSRRLGAITGSGKPSEDGNGKPIVRKHKTTGIRTVLGSKLEG